MNTYQQKLTQLGFTENDLSPKLREEINQHKEAFAEFQGIKAELSQMQEGDEGYDERLESLNEIEETLLEHDGDLVNMLETYAKRKELYLATAQKMKDAKERKKAERIAAAGSPAPQPAPRPAPTPPPVQVPNPSPSAPPVVAAAEKKQDGLGDWLFWGIVGGIGLLVGVNYYKNR